MTERQEELIKHLFDLSTEYYTEKIEDNYLKIPDSQSERQFIQEVFTACWEILDKDENL